MNVGIAYSPIRYGGRRLNELFHCGPYEVKASKFLSFFVLAASLPFNQPRQRQKMAQPSASNPPFRRPRSGLFWGRGAGPFEALSAPPQGWGRAGGEGGSAAWNRGASVCSRMGKGLHGQANIEDDVVSPLADLERAPGTWGVAELFQPFYAA